MPGLLVGQSGLRGALTDPLIAFGLNSAVQNTLPTLGGGVSASAGDLLIAATTCRDNIPNDPSGWTRVGAANGIQVSSQRGQMWYKSAAGGETNVAIHSPGADGMESVIALFRPVANLAGTQTNANVGGTSANPTITLSGIPTGTAPFVVIAFFAGGADGVGNSGDVAVANGYTGIMVNGAAGDAFGPYGVLEYRQFPGGVTNPAITSPNQGWGYCVVCYER
jgi:hypothetical protein